MTILLLMRGAEKIYFRMSPPPGRCLIPHRLSFLAVGRAEFAELLIIARRKTRLTDQMTLPASGMSYPTVCAGLQYFCARLLRRAGKNRESSLL